MTRVLVIGGGGREHAIVHALRRSPRELDILCAPGNGGTAELAQNVFVKADDVEGLVTLARDRCVDLTIVGPEAPLCAGIADRFRAEGMRIFGPTAEAARIEGDKAYSKRLMKSANVPTAEARIFTNYRDARTYVATRDSAIVVKAAGLTAGKGVTVCDDPAEALGVLEKIMVDRIYGEAGDCVIVEERLKGQELSVFALVSGSSIYVLESAQDHKAVGDGDTGPNTGGMGAYSPAPIATPELLDTVQRQVFVPIVSAMQNDGAPFQGLLYAGLMLTPAGPKVLEFNCRFGDPEAQVILSRVASDPLELFEAVVDGTLEDITIEWSPKAAVCVVMAAGGYPGSYPTGQGIEGLSEVREMPDVFVYHAGTKKQGPRIVTNGGRVLGVTALGDDIAHAQRRAYEAVAQIRFEGAHFRRDIAYKALKGAATHPSDLAVP